jgi:hypothetical protein
MQERGSAGVEYDTEKWTWAIPEEKLAWLLEQLRSVMEAGTVRQEEIWSLAGRIMHYAPLIPAGKFNIRHFLKANAVSADGRHPVTVNPELKRLLHFWLIVVRATLGTAEIPRPEEPLPAWATEFYTDAAGGTMESMGRGCGGVSGTWWFYVRGPGRSTVGLRHWTGRN